VNRFLVAASISTLAAAALGCESRPLGSALMMSVNGGAGGASGATGTGGTPGPAPGGGGDGGAVQPTGAGGASGAPGEPTTVVSRIAAGHYHTCALMADATARCWGNNYGGMIGDGTSGNVRLAPVPVAQLSGAIKVLASYTDSCAQVLQEGPDSPSWRCWGSNNYGQLGDGTVTQQPLPVSVLAGLPVRQLSLGVYHSCAVLADNTVRCYGANYAGQLGDGTKVDRLVPTPVPGLGGVAQIAAGAVQSCALLGGGAVSCWGYNWAGTLGDGTTIDRSTPGPVPGLSGAAKVVVGANLVCVLLAEGRTVSCWGANEFGQVGDGTTINRNRPTAVPGLAGVHDLVAGVNHVCALLTDGTVSCWGYNVHGELGDGTTINRASPTPVPGLAEVAQISLGVSHTCAVLRNEAVLCWGDELAFVDTPVASPYRGRLTPTPIAF
jgi:alpha-tubulin suppressor-like RCC1 family protein